ncbi:MAG TPA: DUF3459 domain-containing protein, partial [Arthrobacter sp.]|nr:DUF3459 domain-containing protein [Arthrobacter sp.]
DDAGWLRFRRGSIEVLLNLSDAKVRLENVPGAVLLATDEGTGLDGEALALAPWSAAIVKS